MRGHPHAFRCTRCRRSPLPWPFGSTSDVTLTGRRRPNRSRKRGGYWPDEAFEYTCRCGHVGWSTHPDIARKAAREADDA